MKIGGPHRSAVSNDGTTIANRIAIGKAIRA